MDPGEPTATQAALEAEQEKDTSTAPEKSGTETDIKLLTQKMEQQVEEYRKEIRECQMEAMRVDFHDILTEQSQILAIDPQSFTTLKRGLIEKYIEIKLQHDELIEKAIDSLPHASLTNVHNYFADLLKTVIESPEYRTLFAKRIAIKKFTQWSIVHNRAITVDKILGFLTLSSLPPCIQDTRFDFYNTIITQLQEDQKHDQDARRLQENTGQLRTFEKSNSLFVPQYHNEALSIHLLTDNQPPRDQEITCIPDWPLATHAITLIPAYLGSRLESESQKHFAELVAVYHPGQSI